MSDAAQAFEEIGRAIARGMTESMDTHVASAETKLNDDDLIAFGLVAIRRTDEHGLQEVGQRAIDPEVVMDSDHEPEKVVDALHTALCQTWDEEVADRE